MKLTVEKSGFRYESIDTIGTSLPKTTRKVTIALTQHGTVSEEVATLLERVGRIPEESDRLPRSYGVTIFSVDNTGRDTSVKLGALFFSGNPPRSAHEAFRRGLTHSQKDRQVGDMYHSAEIYVMPPKDVILRKLEREKKPVTIFLLILLIIRRKLKGILVLVLYGGFHLIEIYGKFFVNHNPPPEFMLRTERFVHFPQFHIRTENSYPSGHAGRALFITLILFLIIGDSKKIPKTMKLFIFGALTVYDIVMLVSRVYLGEHWFSDVMGGSILGAGLALIGILAL